MKFCLLLCAFAAVANPHFAHGGATTARPQRSVPKAVKKPAAKSPVVRKNLPKTPAIKKPAIKKPPTRAPQVLVPAASDEWKVSVAQLKTVFAHDRFVTPDEQQTWREFVNRKRRARVNWLLSLIEDPKQSLRFNATRALIVCWDDLLSDEVSRYLNHALEAKCEARPRYPQGTKASVEIGYRARYEWDGVPTHSEAWNAPSLQVTARVWLDEAPFGEPYSHNGPMATTHWIGLGNARTRRAYHRGCHSRRLSASRAEYEH